MKIKTKKIDKYFKLIYFKKTQDDWRPNYPQNEVRLMCCPLTDGKFRVAVWGADDLGYEFDYDAEKEARDIYDKLSKEKYINFKTVKNLGFYRA
jgi:hypothetical protein